MQSPDNIPEASASDRVLNTPLKLMDFARYALVGFIGLVLLIPLGMISFQLDDRQQYRDTAVNEIANTWGGEVNFTGPILVIPYMQVVPAKSGEKETIAHSHIYILPEKLEIDCNANAESRKRGIFSTVVFTTDLNAEGQFRIPTLAELGVAAEAVRWENAYLSIGLDEIKGITELVKLKWGQQELAFTASSRLPDITNGLNAPVTLTGAGENIAFAFNLKTNGSERLFFTAVGDSTTIKMTSNWGSPSFQGEFLPEKREVRADGFEATWNVSLYGRTLPGFWKAYHQSDLLKMTNLNASRFGVNLMEPVDNYRTVERTIKYGVLFIVLVFSGFILFEMFNRLVIHPIQYLLVGAALVLFSLVLLALSEFLSFNLSYIIAAGISTGMITLYSASVLKSGKRALWLGLGMVAIYGYLLTILWLQDYALLAGTAGLLVIIGLFMVVTRNLSTVKVRK